MFNFFFQFFFSVIQIRYNGKENVYKLNITFSRFYTGSLNSRSFEWELVNLLGMI